MNEVDERIREALAAVDGEDAAPDFEAVWGRALARSEGTAGRSRRRWPLLVPALGAAALIAILVGLLAPAVRPDEAAVDAENPAPSSLDGLPIPRLDPLPSDVLSSGSTRAGDVDQEMLLAWNEKMLGSPTDWLLTLEIPRWDDERERKLP